MLKSELMDLLHEIEDDVDIKIYLEIDEKFKQLKGVYVDKDGDIILTNRRESI